MTMEDTRYMLSFPSGICRLAKKGPEWEYSAETLDEAIEDASRVVEERIYPSVDILDHSSYKKRATITAGLGKTRITFHKGN